MRIPSTQRIVFSALVVILIVLTTIVFNYKDKIWSVTGQSAFELAKIKWAEGQKQEALEFWLYGIDRTMRDSVNRERAYSIVRRSDGFLEEGKLTEALDACHEAEKIYNEEGEITYHCMLIEERILEITTPVP
jgi:hypothetical protein